VKKTKKGTLTGMGKKLWPGESGGVINRGPKTPLQAKSSLVFDGLKEKGKWAGGVPTKGPLDQNSKNAGEEKKPHATKRTKTRAREKERGRRGEDAPTTCGQRAFGVLAKQPRVV